MTTNSRKFNPPEDSIYSIPITDDALWDRVRIYRDSVAEQENLYLLKYYSISSLVMGMEAYLDIENLGSQANIWSYEHSLNNRTTHFLGHPMYHLIELPRMEFRLLPEDRYFEDQGTLSWRLFNDVAFSMFENFVPYYIRVFAEEADALDTGPWVYRNFEGLFNACRWFSTQSRSDWPWERVESRLAHQLTTGGPLGHLASFLGEAYRIFKQFYNAPTPLARIDSICSVMGRGDAERNYWRWRCLRERDLFKSEARKFLGVLRSQNQDDLIKHWNAELEDALFDGE